MKSIAGAWPEPKDVVHRGVDAKRAADGPGLVAQRPGPLLVGHRRPPGRVDLHKEVAAQGQEGLGRDLHVAADEELAFLVLALGRLLAVADHRPRLGVASNAGDAVDARAGLDVVRQDLRTAPASPRSRSPAAAEMLSVPEIWKLFFSLGSVEYLPLMTMFVSFAGPSLAKASRSTLPKMPIRPTTGMP